MRGKSGAGSPKVESLALRAAGPCSARTTTCPLSGPVPGSHLHVLGWVVLLSRRPLYLSGCLSFLPRRPVIALGRALYLSGSPVPLRDWAVFL